MPMLDKAVALATDRMPKVITPGLHAAIDYATVASFAVIAAFLWKKDKRASIAAMVCDGSLATADTWLKNNLAPLLNNAQFKSDGILIVAFDEAASTDTTHGGGHILTVVVGPKVKKGYAATHNYYQQQSLLKTIE